MEIPKKDIQTHSFEGGMDSDTAPELLLPNRARYMLNVRSYSFGERGLITNVKGNTLISTPLPAGNNICIGWGSDEENNQFYFIVFNSTGLHTVLMYDGLKNTVVVLLQSKTDSNGVDILTLNKDYLINHVDVIPSINGPLITWSDGFNKATKFNRNKALDKSATGYGLIIFKDFITAYKKCSVYAPVVSYITDVTRNSNFLYGKLFKFCVRYIYDDGEQSNWSDYSLPALPPNQSYSGINNITYDNNCIQVSFETGNQLVIKIEVAMKVGSLDFVETVILDKATLAIKDNSTYVFKFYNDGADVPTDQEKIVRQYSFLPDKPFCQAFVKNAMTYTKFFEGFAGVNIDIKVDISYQDIYIPDGTVNQLNSPAFLTELITNGYSSGSLGVNKRYNVIEHFEIGFDVKAGNKFQLFGRNGGSANFNFMYTATVNDTAITIANQFKSYLRGIGRGMPEGNNGISNENIDSGNVSWDYQILGFWNESPISWTATVNPVNFSTLKDDGLSINLIKPGSVRKYAIAYEDDDGRKGNGNTSDDAVANTGFITQVGDLKRGVHRISISNPPPVWARYYYLLRTPDSGPWIEMLIQQVIAVDPDPTQIAAGNSQKYIDLVVGSLFTYQKLHPNTILVYDFEKGDRLRLIKYYDPATEAKTLYPYIETEVLSYSIDTEEIVNEVIALNGTDTVVINGVANPDYIGKTLVVGDNSRQIIGVPAGNKYQLDGPIVGGTLTEVDNVASFTIVDKRGILRIKKPDNVDVHDLSLVEIYKPQLNESVDGYKQFFPFGMKLEIGNYGTPEAYHAGTVQNQYQNSPSDPAIIDVIQGDAYLRNRELPTNTSVPGTQLLVDHVTDPNFSDFYESDLSNLGRVFPQDDGSGVKYFGSRTRFSNAFIEDTKVNGLNDFDNLDRVDYNDPYGDVMLTKFHESKLYYYKFLKTGWTNVLASIIQDNSDQKLLGTSSKLLNQMEYYSLEAGIGNNPESYVRNGNYQYFAAAKFGMFIRVAADGCDPISSIYDYDKESRRILGIADKLGLRIFGGVDRENKEIIWAIPAYNNYIFKGGFVPNEWNTFNDAVPAGTTFEIVAQPAHSTVSINGDGQFVIITGTTLGDDFFTYRARLSDGSYLPTRKECFTVVQNTNRPKGYQFDSATKYCLKYRETGWEKIVATKYCLKGPYFSLTVNNTEHADPYSDSNVDIKLNGVDIARITGAGTTNYTLPVGGVLSAEGFSEEPSTGSSPTKTLEVIVNGSTVYGPTTNSNNPGDASLFWNTYSPVDGDVIVVNMSAAATAFDPDAVGILVVDINNDSSLNVIGFVDTPGAIIPYQQPVYTGQNFYPGGGVDPANCWALASDLDGDPVLKWRFQFNIAQLMSLYPGEATFVLKIKGRGASAGTIGGSYNLKGADAGKMIMTGSSGTYLPSTSGTTNIGITSYSGKAISGGADGTYGIGVGADILVFQYDVASKTMTLL
jgi:hypothetical protein